MQCSYIHQSTAYVTLIHHLPQYNQDNSCQISYHQVWIALTFKCIRQFCAIKGHLDIFWLSFSYSWRYFLTAGLCKTANKGARCRVISCVIFLYSTVSLLKPLCCAPCAIFGHNNVFYVNITLNKLNYTT